MISDGYDDELRGLWIDDLYNHTFTGYMFLPHSPLIGSELVTDCPDIRLLNISQNRICGFVWSNGVSIGKMAVQE